MCGCEEEGWYFSSGFKGILAHIENGKIISKVERCDICKIYDSDEEAEQKLKELLGEVV